MVYGWDGRDSHCLTGVLGWREVWVGMERVYLFCFEYWDESYEASWGWHDIVYVLREKEKKWFINGCEYFSTYIRFLYRYIISLTSNYRTTKVFFWFY